MQTPTTDEICAAIQVLKKLGEHMNERATHSKLQMPESQLGGHYAARIEVNSIERIASIETVAMQLQNWRDELLQQPEQSNSDHV
jgi:hypothetical protein